MYSTTENLWYCLEREEWSGLVRGPTHEILLSGSYGGHTPEDVAHRTCGELSRDSWAHGLPTSLLWCQYP